MESIAKMSERQLGDILDCTGKLANNIARKKYSRAMIAAQMLVNLSMQFKRDLQVEVMILDRRTAHIKQRKGVK